MFFNKVRNRIKGKQKDNDFIAINVEDVFVLKTRFIPSYDSKRIVTLYYLAIEYDDDYYEFFSNKKLSDQRLLDEPFIVDVKPLDEYDGFDDGEYVTNIQLMDFITKLNVKNFIKN